MATDELTVDVSDVIVSKLFDNLSKSIKEITSPEAMNGFHLSSSQLAYALGAAICLRIHGYCAKSTRADGMSPSSMTIQHLSDLTSGFVNQLEAIRNNDQNDLTRK